MEVQAVPWQEGKTASCFFPCGFAWGTCGVHVKLRLVATGVVGAGVAGGVSFSSYSEKRRQAPYAILTVATQFAFACSATVCLAYQGGPQKWR